MDCRLAHARRRGTFSASPAVAKTRRHTCSCSARTRPASGAQPDQGARPGWAVTQIGGAVRLAHNGALPDRSGTHEGCALVDPRATAGPSTQETAVHHEEWWRVVLRGPQANGGGSNFPRKGKGVHGWCRDERQAGMMVECRAFRSRCDRSSRVDAATVVARRARLRRLMLGAVGMVLAGLLVLVARSQLGGLRGAVGAVTLLVGAPTDRPAASGKDEQRDQEPGDSLSPAGADGGHERQAGSGTYSRLSPRAPGVLRPWPVAGFTAWAPPCEAIPAGSGEDGLIFELEMALVRPGAEGQRPPGQLPPGRGVRTINLGYLGDTLPSDSTPGGWRSADMNSERASGYLGRKKPPPTRSQDLPLAYGLRTPPGRSE